MNAPDEHPDHGRTTPVRGTVDGLVEPVEPVDDVDRQHAAARIRVALDDGVLTLHEAGERLSAVYRARSRTRLDRLTVDLDPPAKPAADGLNRATLLLAGLRVLLLAALAALLLVALLHGIGPIDRF